MSPSLVAQYHTPSRSPDPSHPASADSLQRCSCPLRGRASPPVPSRRLHARLKQTLPSAHARMHHRRRTARRRRRAGLSVSAFALSSHSGAPGVGVLVCALSCGRIATASVHRARTLCAIVAPVAHVCMYVCIYHSNIYTTSSRRRSTHASISLPLPESSLPPHSRHGVAPSEPARTDTHTPHIHIRASPLSNHPTGQTHIPIIRHPSHNPTSTTPTPTRPIRPTRPEANP